MSRPPVSTDGTVLPRAGTLVDTRGAPSHAFPTPPDWQVVPIGQLATVTRGASPRPIDDPAWFDTDSRTGWLRIADVTAAGKYLLETRQGLSAAGMAHSQFVRSGNLVMSICATVGRPIVTAKDVCIHDGFVVFEDLKADIEYFYYVLSGMETTWSERGQTGSQMNLNTDIIKATTILLPPPNQQRAIAEALSAIDDLLQALGALIVKKQTVKRAAMQHLLTGKTRLQGFRETWVTRRLADLVDVDPENLPSHTNPEYRFNYISLEDVNAGRLLGHKRETFRTAPSRARRVLRYDDVLVSTVRPTLRAHLLFREQWGNAVCSTGFAVLRSKRGLSVSGFVFQHLFGYIVNEQIERTLAGSNYPAITSRDVQLIEIPCPPWSEQHAIATVLSEMDAEIAALEQRLDKTRAIKHGMMQRLLTGRVRLL